jgi:hypothetical protein
VLNFHGPFNTARCLADSHGCYIRGGNCGPRNPPQAESKINSISKVVFFMRSPLNLSSLSVTERSEGSAFIFLLETARRAAHSIPMLRVGQLQYAEKLLERATSFRLSGNESKAVSEGEVNE